MILALLPLLPLTLAPVQLPSTEPAKVFTEFMELCAAPDLARLTGWAEARLGPELMGGQTPAQVARSIVDDCTADGPATVLEVVESTPRKLVLSTRATRTGVALRTLVELDEHGKVS